MDDIPNWMQIHKGHVPNHQPDYVFMYISYMGKLYWLTDLK